MTVVNSEGELRAALESAKAIAARAFGLADGSYTQLSKKYFNEDVRCN